MTKKRDPNEDRIEHHTGQKSKENKIIQNVWYLPQINGSPTSHAVVVEILRRSLKIADEANRDSISETYDVAISEIALQVQAKEKPTFDRIFILLGSFHIEMTFFFSYWKVNCNKLVNTVYRQNQTGFTRKDSRILDQVC